MGDEKKDFTLTLAMIVKNEEKTLPTLWASIKSIVDEWVVVDTGSTDNTVEIAKGLGAKVIEVGGKFNTPITADHVKFFKSHGVEVSEGSDVFHFGNARTFSFEQATSEYILWLDADDIFVGAKALKRIMNGNLDKEKQLGLHLLYKYELDAYQNPIVEHYRERVVPNNGQFNWVGRIHEILVPELETKYIRVNEDDCHVLHNAQETHKDETRRNQLALLMDLYEQKDKPDPRTLQQLAECFKIQGQFKKSIELYEQYMKLSGWDEERCTVSIRLNEAYRGLKDTAKAIDWAYRAVKERPDFPIGYSALAQTYFEMEEFAYAERFALQCLEMEQPETLVFVNQKQNVFRPLQVIALVYMHSGRLKDALHYCNQALEFEPQNPMLNNMKLTCEQLMKEQRVTRAIGTLALFLRDEGELAKAYKMTQCLPLVLSDAPQVAQLQHDIQGEIVKRTNDWQGHDKRLEKGKLPQAYQLLAQDLHACGVQRVLLVSNEPVLAEGLKQLGYHVKRVIKVDQVKEDYDAVVFDYCLQYDIELLELAYRAGRFVGVVVPNRDPKAVVACGVDTVRGWLQITKGRPWNVMPLKDGLIYGSALLGEKRVKEKVTIFCGESTEEWGPLSHVEGGVGGSEEAVIYLTRELALQGHEVEVINAYPHPCTVHGVRWRHFASIKPDEKFDQLVLWRLPHLKEMYGKLKANKTFLWLHDVPQDYWWTKEKKDAVDVIFALSEFHKSLLPSDLQERVVVTGNGVDVRQFKGDADRDPHRVIYTSSYDRGLEHLLDVWPFILAEFPDAKLDIFYGWGTYDKLRTKETQRQWKSRMIDLMSTLPGVTEHGRIGQDQLATEMLKSGVFAYPCHFEEISCISAMKAQVAGCIPLTTSYAALAETNLQKEWRVDGNPRDDEKAKEAFKNRLLDALRIEKDARLRRTIQVQAQQKFAWSTVAEQWSGEFTKERVEA